MAGIVDVARTSLLIAAAVALLGWLGSGSGPVNGDAAVYLWQASNEVFLERTVHLGYIVLIWAIGPDASDLLTCVSAAGLCLGAARWRQSWVAALIVGAAVLPLASFAEVDVPWACAVSWILASKRRWVAAGWAAVAMSLSPLTLLALPWVLTQRRDGWILASSLFSVWVLTVVGSGDWWIGGRGVLHGPPLLPGRTAESWLLHAPWLALPLAWSRALPPQILAMLPLLLAPPDVGGWLIGALCLGGLASESTPQRSTAAAVLLATCAWGLFLRQEALHQTRTENAQIAAIVEQMGPTDGLVSSWSVGVRASIRAGQGPYGLQWRKPNAPWRGPPPAGQVYRMPTQAD